MTHLVMFADVAAAREGAGAGQKAELLQGGGTHQKAERGEAEHAQEVGCVI